MTKYADRIEKLGGFNSMDIHYYNVLKNKKYLNLNSPNIQLIVAIHYLSLNDQEKRKDKWATK